MKVARVSQNLVALNRLFEFVTEEKMKKNRSRLLTLSLVYFDWFGLVQKN